LSGLQSTEMSLELASAKDGVVQDHPMPAVVLIPELPPASTPGQELGAESPFADKAATAEHEASEEQELLEENSEEKGAATKEQSEMPAATLKEFFCFLQCQLRKEAEIHLGLDVPLKDKLAAEVWPEYEEFVKKNLGGNERWVPYHTILGVHEKFLAMAVHHARHEWTDRQRFIAMFIFRAHCKADVFSKAQLPILITEAFWKDPLKAFEVGGEMETALVKYRRTTKRPLLTLCFRMIPERILKDDDANLVRSIILRTQKLVKLADQIFPMLMDGQMSASDKFENMTQLIKEEQGLGETWAKMLTVCTDLAYPEMGLLASQCEVGIGALTPLRRLLPGGGVADAKKALEELRQSFNNSPDEGAQHFWDILMNVEARAREYYEDYPLLLQQFQSERGNLSPATLQVQLCEYRQFRHALARSRYDLPLDESMKEPERERRARRELERDEERGVVILRLPSREQDAAPVEVEVPVASLGGRWRVAERVASLCGQKLSMTGSKAEAEAFREELVAQWDGSAPDVPEESMAWGACQCGLSAPNPLVGVSFQPAAGGKKIPFQTTVHAAGGVLEAERIARLCYQRLVAGATKEQVLELRGQLYAERAAAAGVGPPQKRPKQQEHDQAQKKFKSAVKKQQELDSVVKKQQELDQLQTKLKAVTAPKQQELGQAQTKLKFAAGVKQVPIYVVLD